MNKRPRILLLVLPLLLCFGPLPEAPAGRPSAGQTGLSWLEQLVLADPFREAGRLAAEVLAGPTADARTLAVCGLAYLKMGRIAEAEALFNKVLELAPDNAEAQLGLGRIDRIRNDADGALCHLRRAVRTEVFYGEAFRQLWRAAWDNGRVCDLFDIYERAEECYRRRSRPLPSWFTNGMSQIGRLPGERLFKMKGRFEQPLHQVIRNMAAHLTDEQLKLPVGDHWTIAILLTQLAFWDLRVLSVLDPTEAAGKLVFNEADISVNDYALPLLAAIPPREAARRAIEAAEAIDKRLESFPPALLEQVFAHNPRWVMRLLHRNEHLDEAEAALKT